MTDRISITGLKVAAHIGVTEEERARPQTLVVNLELEADLRRAGASDDLDDTVDYDNLATSVAGLIRESETKLVESLAEKVASHVCASKKVDRVTVELMKESPPVAEDVGPIAVRITRP